MKRRGVHHDFSWCRDEENEGPSDTSSSSSSSGGGSKNIEVGGSCCRSAAHAIEMLVCCMLLDRGRACLVQTVSNNGYVSVCLLGFLPVWLSLACYDPPCCFSLPRWISLCRLPCSFRLLICALLVAPLLRPACSVLVAPPSSSPRLPSVSSVSCFLSASL